ncbi:uncharacterized protein LOC134242692 [Saccostrea cucullata]|uniref:uncharacterized protein LOC134242692 n=1 Tax=Saccostrea cuccullata TaxID=36930 RepID=UPI002ED4FDC4
MRRDAVINQMAALFPNGTDDYCECNKSFDLHYSGGRDRTAWDCARHYHSNPYRSAISHFLDQMNIAHSTSQSCHSHTAVWQELAEIVEHNHDGHDCAENLIRHLYDSVRHQGDPCSCHTGRVPI